MLLRTVYSIESTFNECGVCDWKNEVRAFERHNIFDCHRESVYIWQSISKATASVGVLLNKQLLSEQRAAAAARLSHLFSPQYSSWLGRAGVAWAH